MPLTPDQRREVNRANARKSTGPKSEAGKARSRGNALTHGLTAKVVALPGEDEAAVAARGSAWASYYRPESPAAHHLLNECVRATLMADRLQRRHDAEVARQAREAVERWDRARSAEVEGLVALLARDPAAAVEGLRRTSDGCRELASRWADLAGVARGVGFWDEAEVSAAIRLQGFHPAPGVHPHRVEPWLTRLYNLLRRPEPDLSEVRRLFSPDVRPKVAHGGYTPDDLPDPDWCASELDRMAADARAGLEAEAARLEATVDGPDRAGAVDRALWLNDPDHARLFLRYHAETRSTFHRSFGALVKALDRDAEESRNEASGEEGGRMQDAGCMTHESERRDCVLPHPASASGINDSPAPPSPGPLPAGGARGTETQLAPSAGRGVGGEGSLMDDRCRMPMQDAKDGNQTTEVAGTLCPLPHQVAASCIDHTPASHTPSTGAIQADPDANSATNLASRNEANPTPPAPDHPADSSHPDPGTSPTPVEYPTDAQVLARALVAEFPEIDAAVVAAVSHALVGAGPEQSRKSRRRARRDRGGPRSRRASGLVAGSVPVAAGQG